MLFFTGQNLLTEVDVVLAGVPIASMVATLWVIRKFVAFEEIPGFDKLSGMVMLALLAFACLLLVLKLRIFVGVFAGVYALLGLFLLLYLAFHWAWGRVTR